MRHSVSAIFDSSVSKIIRQQQSVPPSLTSWRWQILISFLLMLHLFSVAISYSANWRRSSIQDAAIVWLQPYLIGANWYQEMLPIEWISENNRPGSIQLLVEHEAGHNHWVPTLDSDNSNNEKRKFDRLLHVLSELAIGEDSQGLTRILKSIVLHLEAGGSGNASRISKIRLLKRSESNLSKEADSVLYEAALARFPSGEFGFIPKIDSHRSVRAHETVQVNQ